MWYVTLNGVLIPTPYILYRDAYEASLRIKEANSPCIVDTVYIPNDR